VAIVSGSMRRARWIGLIIPTGLLLAATAGCGGGKEQVSAAELVQKGDAICRDEQSRFNQVQAAPLRNASDGADQADALLGAVKDAVGSLRDLGPPKPEQAAYDRYLDAKERAVQYFEQGKDAADNQDGPAYSGAQAAVARGAPERAKLAKAVGFRACSQTSQTP
jgi:hypothetical protein